MQNMEINNKYKNAKIYADDVSDIMYFVFKEGIIEEVREIATGINAEVDSDGNIVGIEILNYSRLKNQTQTASTSDYVQANVDFKPNAQISWQLN